MFQISLNEKKKLKDVCKGTIASIETIKEEPMTLLYTIFLNQLSRIFIKSKITKSNGLVKALLKIERPTLLLKSRAACGMRVQSFPY